MPNKCHYYLQSWQIRKYLTLVQSWDGFLESKTSFERFIVVGQEVKGGRNERNSRLKQLFRQKHGALNSLGVLEMQAVNFDNEA